MLVAEFNKLSSFHVGNFHLNKCKDKSCIFLECGLDESIEEGELIVAECTGVNVNSYFVTSTWKRISDEQEEA